MSPTLSIPCLRQLSLPIQKLSYYLNTLTAYHLNFFHFHMGTSPGIDDKCRLPAYSPKIVFKKDVRRDPFRVF